MIPEQLPVAMPHESKEQGIPDDGKSSVRSVMESSKTQRAFAVMTVLYAECPRGL